MRFALYSKDQDLEEAVFAAAMYWRILYGALRIYIGYRLIPLVGTPALDVYHHVFRHKLTQDPDDALLRLTGHLITSHSFSITYFLVGYLLFWGFIDIVLSVSMLQHYLWAFSTSMVVIGLFIAYEVYRDFHTHSHTLFVFILIDLFILYLIYHERNRLMERKRKLLVSEGRV